MELNKNLKQIFLTTGYPTDINGKTVKMVGFSSPTTSGYGENQLTIVFTDNTFVSFEIDYDEDEHYVYINNNGYSSIEPKNINDGIQDHWFDSNGNLRFSDWVQKLVDLGIWNVSEDEVKALKEKKDKQQELRDYQRYLELKERFENKDISYLQDLLK